MDEPGRVDDGRPAADAPLDDARRAALGTLSRGAAVTAMGMLTGGCLGGIVAGLLTAPAAAGSAASAASAAASDAGLDVQMLQTASSLETLLIDLYGAALGVGPLGADAPSARGVASMVDPVTQQTLKKILTETQAQHREHRLAFQALTTALGGKEQNEPNGKYLSGVAAADVSSPLRLVDYAAVLEKIVTDTYILDITMAENVKAKGTLASVMAVEAQHLAVLRTVGALLRDSTPQFVKIPIGADLVNLPATLAAVAFPNAMDDVTPSSSVAEPETGALP